MVREYTIIMIIVFTREIGKMIKNKEWESIYIVTETLIQGFLTKI